MPSSVRKVISRQRSALRRPALAPVRTRKLSHLVADALRTCIANRELQRGEQLPSEAEMLRDFGVSRPTLREALRVVEAEGLIQLGRGSRTGAMVLGPSVEVAARYGELYLAEQNTALGEVHEVRTLLEPSLVSRLAARPSARLLSDLRAAVRDEQEALGRRDFQGAVDSLNVFHRVVVEASANRALKLLAGIVEGIPGKVYAAFLAEGNGPVQQAFLRRTSESVAAHARLVTLIAARDAAGAEKFWRSYMEETATFLDETGLATLRVKPPVSLL